MIKSLVAATMVAAMISLPVASAGAQQPAAQCPQGYTLHPQINFCVAEPTCPPGSTLHPRLHQCVRAPTCPSGSTWHPQLTAASHLDRGPAGSLDAVPGDVILLGEIARHLDMLEVRCGRCDRHGRLRI